MRKRTFCRVSFCVIALLFTFERSEAAPMTNGGPGGIGTTDGASTLDLWFRGDDGVFADTGGTTGATDGNLVGRWNDISGNVQHGTESDSGFQPTFRENVAGLNGRDAIEFIGPVSGGSANVNVGDRLSLGAFTMTGDETAFFALDFDTVCCRGVLSGNNSPNRAWAGGNNSMFESTNFTFADNYWVDGVDTPSTGAGFHVVTGEMNPFAGNVTNLRLGAGHGGNADYRGVLAEAIVFDEQLNRAQQMVVENYLSARYDIALDSGDIYAGDSVSGDFDFDVFGINAINPGGGLVSHDSGGSGGLGIEAMAALADGESVMAGHNGIDGGLTNAGLANMLDQRLLRTWYIDDRASVGIELVFDLSDAGIDPESSPVFTRLVFSSDGTNFETVDAEAMIVGDRITFLLDDADFTTGIFTLATAVPEPSSCLLLAFGGMLVLRLRRRP